MAPSPENDNAPKAPDKGTKAKGCDAAQQDCCEVSAGCENKESSVSRLDDIELKALLDEAINYKIPKDREGKSKLFQNLLEKAEEDDRKARATSASGSESVRYYNSTHRTRRRREQSSVSENLTHGGSLNNLTKEELYTVANHLNRPIKTVSTRQRQGGSLPCNVNAGLTLSYDKQFFEEARQKVDKNRKIEYTAIDMESESLLEHDSLGQNYEQPELEVVQTRIPRVPIKYTTRYNLEIGGGGGGNVDDPVMVSALERSIDKAEEVTYKPVETITASTHYPAAHLYMPSHIWSFNNRKAVEDKKVDENGNAVGQNSSDAKKSKKKKIQTDKNVVVLEAKDVAGHRGDIIDDLDKLMAFIGGNDEQGGARSKSNMHKAKLQKQHFEDKGKKRTRTKGKSEKLQKSNSMEEISVSKLDDFTFSQEDVSKVPLRGTKSNAERPRERRSWGNSESFNLQSLPLRASVENLENADFHVVTKKKKSKKRRNSVSSGRHQPTHDFGRMPLSEPRRKSACCSAPHSDKSNDSSDVDSVHSLPIDTADRLDHATMPISYADIAKNSERPKWNRPPSERNSKNDASPDKTEVKDIYVHNWPAINNNNNKKEQPKANSNKSATKTSPNNFRNAKANKPLQQYVRPLLLPNNILDVESAVQMIQNSGPNLNNVAMPHNIPDVQTIEKMHFKQLHQAAMQMHQQNMLPSLDINYSQIEQAIPPPPVPEQRPVVYVPEVANHIHISQQQKSRCANETLSPHVPLVSGENCDNERTATTASARPAVVILSGDSKEVSGITFGFDINEQLLSDDVCDSFTARFYVPDVFRCHNHDKIVNFIGLAWEDTVNGKAKYFSDL